MAKTKKGPWRFYRSNLPTVVWDPKAGQPLAEFVEGEFITDDEDVAAVLRSKKYPEVGLDDLVPPDILYGRGITLEGDVKILRGGMGSEQAALNKERSQAALEKSRQDDDTASPVPDRVKKKKKSDSDKTKKKKKKKSKSKNGTSKKSKKSKKADND